MAVVPLQERRYPSLSWGKGGGNEEDRRDSEAHH